MNNHWYYLVWRQDTDAWFQVICFLGSTSSSKSLGERNTLMPTTNIDATGHFLNNFACDIRAPVRCVDAQCSQEPVQSKNGALRLSSSKDNIIKTILSLTNRPWILILKRTDRNLFFRQRRLYGKNAKGLNWRYKNQKPLKTKKDAKTSPNKKRKKKNRSRSSLVNNWGNQIIHYFKKILQCDIMQSWLWVQFFF